MWINSTLGYCCGCCHTGATESLPRLYSSSRRAGSGGRGKGSTADGVVLPPNKYLPAKDAVFFAAFRSRECPVFVLGVGNGSLFLNVTFLFDLVGAMACAVLAS